MTEGVAVVRVDRQLDGRQGGHGMPNVCQKTTRCTSHVARRTRTAKALEPYVGSRTKPCSAARRRAASPAAVGCPYPFPSPSPPSRGEGEGARGRDRKSVGEGKRVDLGG